MKTFSTDFFFVCLFVSLGKFLLFSYLDPRAAEQAGLLLGIHSAGSLSVTVGQSVPVLWCMATAPSWPPSATRRAPWENSHPGFCKAVENMQQLGITHGN